MNKLIEIIFKTKFTLSSLLYEYCIQSLYSNYRIQYFKTISNWNTIIKISIIIIEIVLHIQIMYFIFTSYSKN